MNPVRDTHLAVDWFVEFTEQFPQLYRILVIKWQVIDKQAPGVQIFKHQTMGRSIYNSITVNSIPFYNGPIQLCLDLTNFFYGLTVLHKTITFTLTYKSYIFILRVNTLSGETTVEIVLPPFWKRVYSERKEFAPLGADTF